MGKAAHLQMVGARDEGYKEMADRYPTPPIATESLLRVEDFGPNIWEPACGDGAISQVLKRRGHKVISTDLHYTGYGRPEVDFLDTWADGLADQTINAIITNPPYVLANEFVLHSLGMLYPGSGVTKIAMLLRLAWLEGVGRHRTIFNKHPPARVWVFSKRLPRMHREGWDGPKSSSTMAFAWYVFEQAPTQSTTLGWI